MLGEFPWRVKVGEKVMADDFVNPPSCCPRKPPSDEVTWSQGEYTSGAESGRRSRLPDQPPRAARRLSEPAVAVRGQRRRDVGDFSADAGHADRAGDLVRAVQPGQTGFSSDITISRPLTTGEPSFVTPVFDLRAAPAGLELTIHTNLINNWAYFNFALINEDTGDAFDFGREVSYYAGTDSDGAWSEGGQRFDSVSFPPFRRAIIICASSRRWMLRERRRHVSTRRAQSHARRVEAR